MNKSAKVLVTIGIVIGFIMFFGGLTAIRQESGHSSPGIFGIILMGGAAAGIWSVWKKKNNDQNDRRELEERENSIDERRSDLPQDHK